LDGKHDVTVITQNVDDLHERAGSKNVIHLHGEVLKARPADDEQAYGATKHTTPSRNSSWPQFDESRILTWYEDLNLGDCDKFGCQLRPHIVWFGEGLPEIERAMAIALASEVDVLIVVGTTLSVFPAAMIATETSAKRVFIIDPAPPHLNVKGLTVLKQTATSGVRNVVDAILCESN
jgi:NAD-dependent deacetylase